MAESKYPVRRRRSKMHPLFAELYLRCMPGDSDDPQEEQRARLRKNLPRKQVSRARR